MMRSMGKYFRRIGRLMRLFVRLFVIPLGTSLTSLFAWTGAVSGDSVDCREDYRGILARSGKGLDVKLLLNALQQSLEFEHYLEKRFSQHVLNLLISV